MTKEQATQKATLLVDALDKLCKDIVNAHDMRHPGLAGDMSCDWKKGQKFIKVIRTTGSGDSVWGFINLKHEDFELGDVLMAKSWKAPALNHPRGNILEGYTITGMRQYGPDYIR